MQIYILKKLTSTRKVFLNFGSLQVKMKCKHWQRQKRKKKTKNKNEKIFRLWWRYGRIRQKDGWVAKEKAIKNETDAIFAIRYVPNSFKELESSDEEENTEINEVEENKKTRGRKKKVTTAIEEDLKKLQQDYQNDIEIINAKDFDIFEA